MQKHSNSSPISNILYIWVLCSDLVSQYSRSFHWQCSTVLNDAIRIVRGCMRPTLLDYWPILASNERAELRRQGETLLLAHLSVMDPNHPLHQLTVGPIRVQGERGYNLHPQLCLRHASCSENDRNWAFVHHNGLTLNGTRSTLKINQSFALLSQGPAPSNLGRVCQNLLG